MKKIMPPRLKAGADFFDDTFNKFYSSIGYPGEWIEQGKGYAPDDAYVISHPSWFLELMPPPPMISIYLLFKETVKKHPDDTAVIFLDKKITYSELDILIGKYAALLRKLGIKKGTVVATILPNSLQHIVAFYAVTMIGAVHMPIDVMFKTEEIAYQLKDSGSRTIFVLDHLYEKVRPLKDEGLIDTIIVTHLKDWAAADAVVPKGIKICWDTPKREILGALDFFSALEPLETLQESAVIEPKTDPALLLYTAGIMGQSKGVIETHFNLVFNSLSHSHAFRITDEREVNFSIMPMFHTSGYLLHQLPVLYQGGTVIPIPIFDIEDSYRIIATYNVNIIFAPPTFFIALMSKKELIHRYPLNSIKMTIACSAPVPKEVQDEWKRLTGLDLVNGWGMTETNSGGIISIPKIKEKINAIGIPVFSEVKITDDEGQIVRRKTEGEICYRGLQVAAGYLNKPRETESTFLPDGWLRTGDKGYIDDEDFVYITGRIKDLILVSGYNVSPLEIEHILYQHPAVEEVVVTGHPDPYRGETVKATISLNFEFMGKVTEKDIIDFCKERMATYKVPRIIDFRDILPKSPTGKLIRKMVKDEMPFSG
jgi:long-chain acyl-CoA synthetase